MKMIFLHLGLFAATVLHASAQGTGIFDFSNVGASPDRQVYIGSVRAEGDGYRIAIFIGESGTTDESALRQIGASAGFLTGLSAGQFSGGLRTFVGGTVPGPVMAFQARAWDASTGSTWQEAAANPAGRIGKSAIFEMKTKSPAVFPPEPTPRIGDATGWRGLIIAVPEPAWFAFVTLGVVALWTLRTWRR